MGSEQDTEPAPGAAATEGGFSLELSEDLRDTRGWVHDFAASVIRPAGSEGTSEIQRMIICRAVTGLNVR